MAMLDHLIVPSRDGKASAKLLANLLGVKSGESFGIFSAYQFFFSIEEPTVTCYKVFGKTSRRCVWSSWLVQVSYWRHFKQ